MGVINFDTLPSEKAPMGNVYPKGRYLATIKKAEMKEPKDNTANKPMYLSIEMDLIDPDSNTRMGKFWMNLTESEKNLPRYQLKRFITALKLPIQGEFTLKDLTKMVVNKQLMVDVTPEERTDGKPPQRSVLDINAGDIFYPVTEPEETLDVNNVFFPPEQEAVTMSSY